MLQERGADLVILDLMCPTSTDSRCARDAAQSPVVPIIMLTARSQETDQDRASGGRG